MKRLCLIVLLAAACSNNNNSHGDLVDAAPHTDGHTSVDAPPPGPTLVTLASYGSTPTFVAYRDGTGAWATPQSSDGMYAIHVVDAYEFVAVCVGDDGSLDEVELAATVSGDGASNGFYCGGSTSTVAPVTVVVSGTMNQAGTVMMSDTATSMTAPWNFALNVPTDTTQDLVAVDAAKMLINRNVAITTATTLPTIDLDGSGTALTSEPITITGLLQDDTIGTEVDLYTANDYATISQGTSATIAMLAPSSLLTNNDEELVSASAMTATTSRQVESYDATATEFDLLPRLTGVTFTGTSASWTTLPTADIVEGGVFAAGSGDVTDDAFIEATPSWLAASGATSLAFDGATATGWQAAWSFWTTQAYAPSLAIEVDSQTGYSYSELSPASAFTRRATQHRHHQLQQLHRARRGR